MHPIIFFANLLLASLLCASTTLASDYRVEKIVVYSQALENNMLGSGTDRSASVLIPPGYDDQPEQRYPVIYFLPFHSADYNQAMGYFTWRGRVVNDMASGKIPPMIIVAADGKNKYGACYYNSPVTGNWEDYIAEDLVQYIDANYRTLPQAASRGIGGKSAGAQGAMSIALKRPDVFSAVYSMKGFMAYRDEMWTEENWRDLINGERSFVLGIATAFIPNPDNPPFFIDLAYQLVNDTLEPVPGVSDQLWGGFPIGLIDQYLASPDKLNGIFFESATDDIPGLGPSNADFSAGLTQSGIEHSYVVTEGNHSDNKDTAIDLLLPFFIETLEFDETSTVVENRSWAELKGQALDE
jgi:S-formylglutathione hydrolase